MIVGLFIISFLLVLISFATYRWLLQPKPNRLIEESNQPPLPPTFLFAPDEKALAEFQRLEEEARNINQKLSLVHRAKGGDKEALVESFSLNERGFYDEVLDAFVEQTKTDEEVWSLALFVKDKSLPANSNLADRCLSAFQKNPTRQLLGNTFHVVALSDDADLFQKTIETTIKLWQEKKLAGVSKEEIREIAESEFWVLAQEARNSGAGFLLKQTLSDLRL